jgi:hypothetical protein
VETVTIFLASKAEDDLRFLQSMAEADKEDKTIYLASIAQRLTQRKNSITGF